ncbi:MAG: outer membrane protein assembly factor BamA [Deltaproteobacteria bacterium]|nr:outer membrane protein assembly factor BamA [Deltaproteobacteria bacterium]
MSSRKLFALVLLAASLFAGRTSALDLAEAVGRPVLRVDVVNRSRVSTPELLRLFQLRPGDRYQPDAVQRSLQLLAQKPGVRDVQVTGTEEAQGIVLRLEVLPEALVRSVRFTGNRTLKRKELASRIKVRVDRPAYAPFLEEDVRTIRELYVERGFPAATVTPQVESVSPPFWVKVTYRIDEGEPTRVGRVELTGSGPMERERVLAVVGLSEGSHASTRRLREGVRRLTTLYHREGYPEARAPFARLEKRGEETVLVLPVVAGAPVDFRFEGVTGSVRPLREAMETHFGETVDSAWLSQVAALMAETLVAQGHRNATISSQLVEEEGRKIVTFRVEEGPVARAAQIAFEGNASIPSKKLEPYMSLVEGGVFRRPPVTQEVLDLDVRTLADYYASQGYLEAEVALIGVDVDPSGEARVRIRIHEGTRYRLGEVSFAGAGLGPDEARAIAALPPGAFADPAEAENARVRLLAEVLKRGHPDAQVSYTWTKRPETALVDLAYRMEPGPLVRFGKTVVAGNARTRTSVIERELTFKEGEVWNAQEVLVSRQRLFRLGFFQRVAIEPLGGTRADGTRDVRVEVEEQDAGSLSFGAGYGTEEGFKGFAELGHANLGGAGRDVRLRAQGQINDRSFTLSFREPWFLGQRLSLGLRLTRQIVNLPAYNNSLLALQASLERQLSERVRGSLLYTLESNHLSDVVEAQAVESINNYLLSSVGPLIVWDSRDDPFNPKRGFQHTVQAEWALTSIGSDVQYGRYTATTSAFLTWRRLTLALLARGGFAENLGRAADLPANKRFYLGGRTTVRGFDLDSIGPRGDNGKPLGGDTMVNLKAELRFPIWRQFAGALFWDAGNVWNRQVERVEPLELRQGAGIGLRYVTPIGPIAVDVAHNLSPRDGEAAFLWHFTVGSAF